MADLPRFRGDLHPRLELNDLGTYDTMGSMTTPGRGRRTFTGHEGDLGITTSTADDLDYIRYGSVSKGGGAPTIDVFVGDMHGKLKYPG